MNRHTYLMAEAPSSDVVFPLETLAPDLKSTKIFNGEPAYQPDGSMCAPLRTYTTDVADANEFLTYPFPGVIVAVASNHGSTLLGGPASYEMTVSISNANGVLQG